MDGITVQVHWHRGTKLIKTVISLLQNHLSVNIFLTRTSGPFQVCTAYIDLSDHLRVKEFLARHTATGKLREEHGVPVYDVEIELSGSLRINDTPQLFVDQFPRGEKKKTFTHVKVHTTSKIFSQYRTP